MTWRPRFSLRTLSVFLLLVTSGTGLWWHWAPWVEVSRVQTSHSIVKSLCFSPDGQRLLSFDADADDLQIRDMSLSRLGEELPSLTRNIKYPSQFRVSKMIACGTSPTGHIQPKLLVLLMPQAPGGVARARWLLGTGTSDFPLPHHGEEIGAALSPEGGRLVVYFDNLPYHVYDTATGKLLFKAQAEDAEDYVNGFSADGSRILVASGDRLSARDATTGEEVRDIPRGPSSRLVLSTDGSRLLSLNFRKGEADLCATETGDRVWQFSVRHPFSEAISPDGQLVALGTMSGEITMFRRRRPEWWWGVFWLWEFWLTAVFAGLFVWSVVRDKRALAAAAAPREEACDE